MSLSERQIKDEFVELSPADYENLKTERKASRGCAAILGFIVVALVADFFLSGVVRGFFARVLDNYNLAAFDWVCWGALVLFVAAWALADLNDSDKAQIDFNKRRKRLIVAPIEDRSKILTAYERDKERKIKQRDGLFSIAEDRRETEYIGIHGVKYKDERAYDYWITVKEQRFKVSRELFEATRIGDFVEIHLAPESQTLLRPIAKLENSADEP